jgi:L,D-transpeptidase ErfK/SrfK
MTRVSVGRSFGSLLFAAMTFVASASPETSSPGATSGMTGQRFSHTVKAGESLTLLSARFGIDLAALADLNGLASTARLNVGQTLLVDNRHLMPDRPDLVIVINIPQRMLFHTTADGAVHAYPVGLGRPTWPTFVGRFTIASRETDPVWDVPPSIQAEMRQAGKPVLTRVAPGPQNPLGAFWIGLDRPGYGIHGTNAPASIYRFQTHGCIRLHPDDVTQLFQAVAVGDGGEIVYEPVLLTQMSDGRIWLEAHPDVYRRGRDPLLVTRELARRDELEGDIDWLVVRDVLRAKRGTPVDVTRTAAPAAVKSGSVAGAWPSGPRTTKTGQGAVRRMRSVANPRNGHGAPPRSRMAITIAPASILFAYSTIANAGSPDDTTAQHAR